MIDQRYAAAAATRVQTHEYRMALGTFSEPFMMIDKVNTRSRAEKLWGW